jgi:hypothetical protein
MLTPHAAGPGAAVVAAQSPSRRHSGHVRSPGRDRQLGPRAAASDLVVRRSRTGRGGRARKCRVTALAAVALGAPGGPLARQ